MAIREIFQTIVLLSCQTKPSPAKRIHTQHIQAVTKTMHILSIEWLVGFCFGFCFTFLHMVGSGRCRVSIHHADTHTHENYSDTCTVYLGFFPLCLAVCYVYTLGTYAFHPCWAQSPEFVYSEQFGKKTGEKIKRKCGKIKRNVAEPSKKRRTKKCYFYYRRLYWIRLECVLWFIVPQWRCVCVWLCDVNASCNDSNRLKCLPSFVECTSLIC